ncbi:hypothetical protein BATDEDRAFT_21138 [Batrachochytrium dendrobatidis JAM81]|uniref:SH3 domain-containing protein n=2 Tax=Batrachochytrium dendrobatidis TaxID=109871 RepID=F4NRA6_BATDJ|nr:uncharacterized protein BATDEDRAFT_21138 [Batrachochytrium dendrobatidis JAM81]EGF83720.1 hypothetical protein BATDEDRAFT_21138 [Batrachochytrium dendrobatidis JAM81]OAJ35773.1 hypothetical protein BDEG_20014 [Batrachochytrium dendrobatidis JEL423]|eukprot:XP_006675208.1 hypothetical protein BATDEDRAFT_21138 [Batrachochytrium dendrobatidis JAM81]
MAIIKHLDIIPSIDPSLSSTDFVVEAGWGTPASIVGVIRLAASKPLKEARLILEFQGQTETFWVGSKVRKPGDLPGESFIRKFQQVITVVRDSKEVLEPNEFGSITLPFTIHLPSYGLPPSFFDARGCIKYNLKSTLMWSETFQLLKPTHVANVPITIVMPRAHRLKLIRTPSILEYDTPYDPDRCTCAIRLPTRVYIPGQQFTVQFAISYVPQKTIASIQVSIEGCTTYRSITSDATKRNRNAVVWNPFPLAVTREVPTAGELQSYDPNNTQIFSRTLHLVTDPKYHQPTLESSLITTRSIIKFQIFMDGEEEPHMSFETSVIVIPADTIKETAALRALELARSQIRPANEIVVSTPISMLSHRSKGSSFSTTASIKTPTMSNFNNDDNSTLRPPSSGSGASSYTPSGQMPIPFSNNHHMSGSNNSGMHSVGSTEGGSSYLSSGIPPPRYSISQRSLDTPQSAFGNSYSADTLTTASNANTRSTGESGRRPSLARDLATLPENRVAIFPTETKSEGHESDDELDGLLTIDELAGRLADANLTRKEFGNLMVQAPSAETKAVVNGLLARLDSGYALTTNAIQAAELDGSTPQPRPLSVSQLGQQLAINNATCETSNPAGDTRNSLLEEGAGTSKLQDLLDSLNEVEREHYAKSTNEFVSITDIKPVEVAAIPRPSSAQNNRSTQIQQIDDLLESLLAFEQDHQLNDPHHPSLLTAPPTPEYAALSVVVPTRSSSTTNANDTPLCTPKDAQLSLTPPQSIQQQSNGFNYESHHSANSQHMFNDETLLQDSYSSLPKTQPVMPPQRKQKAVARFSVVIAHTPNRSDELSLHVGDLVCIREIFRDGWCWGYNVLSKSEGSFPMKKVQLYDSVATM